MAIYAPLTMTEGNDETVDVVITASEGLDAVTAVVFYLKDDDCTPDQDGLVLTSADPLQVDVVAQTATEITALAYIPGSALLGSYPRFYHVRAFNVAGQGRDGPYGPVTVVGV